MMGVPDQHPACPSTAGAPQILGTIPSLTPSRRAAPPFPPQDLLLQPHFFRAAPKSSEQVSSSAASLTALSCALLLAHAGSNVRDAGLQTPEERWGAQPAPGQLTLQPQGLQGGGCYWSHAVYSAVCRRFCFHSHLKKRGIVLSS